MPQVAGPTTGLPDLAYGQLKPVRRDAVITAICAAASC